MLIISSGLRMIEAWDLCVEALAMTLRDDVDTLIRR